ncbi:hypothetical protein BpHYR1_008379 [Brachionus plicatilis]|uniref:Uncharacterized protein n=1 Tax=Brachionus plicatilis TaxID=10195 RepID=A0A3M7RRH1_BRAPC|nr:hypothetical protein BpHYR1_008379 [Brachionus plicatilis]
MCTRKKTSDLNLSSKLLVSLELHKCHKSQLLFYKFWILINSKWLLKKGIVEKRHRGKKPLIRSGNLIFTYFCKMTSIRNFIIFISALDIFLTNNRHSLEDPQNFLKK